MLDMPQFELRVWSFPVIPQRLPYAFQAKTLSRTGASPAFFCNTRHHMKSCCPIWRVDVQAQLCGGQIEAGGEGEAAVGEEQDGGACNSCGGWALG